MGKKVNYIGVVVLVVFLLLGMYIIFIGDEIIYGIITIITGIGLNYKMVIEWWPYIEKILGWETGNKKDKPTETHETSMSSTSPNQSPQAQATDHSTVSQHTHIHFHGLSEEVIQNFIKKVQVKSENEDIEQTFHEKENTVVGNLNEQ